MSKAIQNSTKTELMCSVYSMLCINSIIEISGVITVDYNLQSVDLTACNVYSMYVCIIDINRPSWLWDVIHWS